jgi:hypothetical protein
MQHLSSDEFDCFGFSINSYPTAIGKNHLRIGMPKVHVENDGDIGAIVLQCSCIPKQLQKLAVGA